jgi:hypothetical protein
LLEREERVGRLPPPPAAAPEPSLARRVGLLPEVAAAWVVAEAALEDTVVASTVTAGVSATEAGVTAPPVGAAGASAGIAVTGVAGAAAEAALVGVALLAAVRAVDRDRGVAMAGRGQSPGSGALETEWTQAAESG